MSKIPYLDETWNFMGGCTPAGEGCARCWACRQAAGRLKNHPLYKGLTQNGKWTGEIRLCTDIGRSDILEQPLRWRKPRTIGVQFMGDLFHKKVWMDFIGKVFDVMYKCKQHTFQILTKRPDRMAEEIACQIQAPMRMGGFDNVHFGVSCELQKYTPRIETLLKIPAAKRFVSFEPLLGEIDAGWFMNVPEPQPILDYIIIGSESIGGAAGRECKLEWVESLVEQAKAAGVPCAVKQIHVNGKLLKYDKKNKTWPSAWPENLRVWEI